MPFPQPPTVPGAGQYSVPTPVFAPQQPTQQLPPLNAGQGPSPAPQAPTVASGAPVGAVPIYTGGNVGPWGAGSGSSMFGGGFGGLPSLAGAFSAARNMISGNAAGIAGGLIGGLMGGPVGAIAGRYAGNRFFGGPSDAGLPSAWGPGAAYDQMYSAAQDAQAGGMQNTSPEDLAALQERMQGGRRGFGSYRGSGGFVTGVIDPSSLGSYEGSGMDRSRAPQTAADNQMQ